MENKEGSSLAAVNALCTWWNALWKLDISSKIKLFIWKAFQEILPTNFNLKKKGTSKQEAYGRCGDYDEAGLCAIFTCGAIRDLWFLAG